MAEIHSYRRIDAAGACDILTHGNALLLDVRDRSAFESAHVPSAVHVSHANLGSLLSVTPKDRPVVIYCYHGNASRIYARMFADFGFGAVYSVDGGYVRLEAELTGLEG